MNMIRIQDSEKMEIIEEYQIKGHSCRKIALNHNKSNNFIIRLLRLNGVKIKNRVDSIRRYSLNENYFNVIDTEAKAYFLGLMYADGNNLIKNRRASISLQERDSYILDIFRKELDSNKPLAFINNKKRHPSHMDSYTLTIASLKICKDLIKLGCVPRKSLILKFPTKNQVPKHLLRHFVRGYMDGDGCINLSEKKMDWTVTIVSTNNFCLELKKLIKEEFNINSSIKTSKSLLLAGNNITKHFNIGGNLQVKSFLDWLYKDSIFFLKRKQNKYLMLTEWLKNQTPKLKDPKTGRYIKKLILN